jgi:hypothetical protein
MRARTSQAKKILMAVAATLAVAAGFLVAPPPAAMAANPSDFRPGRIISDAVFYNVSAMDGTQVQAFLDQRGGALARYAQNTPSMNDSKGYCRPFNGATNQSAAGIISGVATACGINPQVLLVLLEKEQSLVTRKTLTDRSLNAATGMGCPDTAPCDPAYGGFFYQVYYAARQYQIYAARPELFGHRAGITNQVRFHPNTNKCGKSPVYIENQATAGLYNYTPYQPNDAAMANLYGSASTSHPNWACASYGNRNFWRMFTDWFGSPISGLDNRDAYALINAIYFDVLGRGVDPAGLSTWQSYLIGHGWPALQVANSILYSDEYVSTQIKLAYQTVLRRGFDQGGHDDWLNRIRIGTANVDEVQMTFMKSLEYYERSGSTPAGFTSILYRDLLGRDAAPAEHEYWAEQARLFGTARVVDGIWNSTESAAIRIDAVYQKFLYRGVDAAGIRSWTPLVIAHGNQAVRSTVLNSAEYLSNARARYPQP